MQPAPTNILEKIKNAGIENIKLVPIAQSKNVQIMIKEGNEWILLKETTKNLAEDLLRQAQNRMILG